MIGELSQLGLADDSRVRFFDAIKPNEQATFTSRGARGVFLSQLAVLKEAAADRQSVLILEDDVDFTAAARSISLPSRWDIFYGGYYASQPDELEHSDIIGAHCMGFRVSILDRLIPYLEHLLTLSDHPPIDGAYVWFRRAHPDVATVFAVPPIAEQRPSRTDIAPLRWFDRAPAIKEAVTSARAWKRWARRRLSGNDG
jgi:glycosyl transferase family 25